MTLSLTVERAQFEVLVELVQSSRGVYLLERGLEPLHLIGTSTSSLRVYQFHHPSGLRLTECERTLPCQGISYQLVFLLLLLIFRIKYDSFRMENDVPISARVRDNTDN